MDDKLVVVGDGTPNVASQVSAEYSRLRALYEQERFPTFERRHAALSALIGMLRTRRRAIVEAVCHDFGHRAPQDTELGDLWLSLSQLRYVRAHLASWMSPRRAQPLLVFQPAAARIIPQPLGVVGIIAPWNYPVMLSLTPLAGALAAGNRVMLKLSEHTPKTSALLAEELSAALGDDWISVLLGGVEVGRAVSQQPLDHLLFTGNDSAGRQIAEAAARNLVPVTLELGGKSPAIWHGSFPLSRFVERIVQGKCFNAGQSCVAPDYLLVPEEKAPQVVEALKARVAHCFPTMVDNPDYSGVLGAQRRQRLRALIDDAVGKGAKAVEINPASESFEGSTKLPLTLLLDVPETARVATEEVFGPVLPIVTYRGLEDAIDYVNARPRPLSLYYFDRDDARIQRVIAETTAGGVTINDTLLHFLCDELPRTSVGDSGHGVYLGRRSFEVFSHNKSVVYQSRLTAVGSFAPPYGRWVEFVLRRILRV